MTDLVLYERDGAIVTLTLNQPELRNPVSDDDMVDAILAANKNHEEDVVAYRLERHRGQPQVTRFSEDELRLLRYELGQEIR